MMSNCWGRIIPARFASPVLALSLTAWALGAQPAPTLSAAKRAAIQQLASAVEQARRGASSTAFEQLLGLPLKLPEVADYVWFRIGLLQFNLNRFEEALPAFQKVYSFEPASPLATQAVLYAAEAELRSQRPENALALLRSHLQRLPQPQAHLLLAKVFEALQNPVSAAAQYQQIYFHHATSTEAQEAATALRRLRLELGDRFPPVLAPSIFARVRTLAQARRYAEARQELREQLPNLGGADRETALVQVGAIDFQAREYSTAYRYFLTLELTHPEADAERLYHLVWCARRLDLDQELLAHLRQLDLKYPASPWRLEAQLAAGEFFLNRNEPETFEPIYRSCAQDFAENPQAAGCDWKLTWSRYLRQPSQAGFLFKHHLKRYPTSEKAPASLYFLGRHSEAGDPAAAKAFYAEIDSRYPNHFYAMLARQRLQNPALRQVAPSASAMQWLQSIPFNQNRKIVNFDPLPLTRQRIARAHLLEAAGLNDWAEQELRFAARHESQPHVIALELARLLDKRQAADEALRAVKAYVPNYLSFPWESAPVHFWKVAFPLPFRDLVERYARVHALDPFLVAGLIRQESEFNPKAVSVANAHGLTQVMPATGKWLSRANGIKRFHSSLLFEPEINLKLGTYYLSQLLQSLEGKWEYALASYNGGKSRVLRWLGWASYQEPAEFIETIPLRETRDYVQIVLRNADIYRRLYASSPSTSLARASRPPQAKPQLSKPAPKSVRKPKSSPKRSQLAQKRNKT
ncbi:MAG: transglycosylase SLT domain-containing protein [Bryobacteraceae bacterium]|nr:transglycosylase SLT domain-containing protein [Bryobacteraceae bacterium]MDW8378443.1 transglycosylase SLT domain-containing protein [Bryobacterales bacterium]